MAGNQSRALIIASRMRGWDPTRVEGGGSIANFDKDMGNAAGQPVGRIPGLRDGYPDGHDVRELRASDAVPFAHPDTSRELADHRTVDAAPSAGMASEASPRPVPELPGEMGRVGWRTGTRR